MTNYKKLSITAFAFLSCVFMHAQLNWIPVNDTGTNISFVMLDNLQQYDTLSTRFYASQISDTEAVQVHVFENAVPDFSDEVLTAALEQAEGDTLLSMALLMALVSDCEIESLTEIYENANRGIELKISYLTQNSAVPYSTIIRYFMIDGNFVAFTWTGEATVPSAPGIIPNPSSQNRNIFFQSVSIP